MADLDNLLNRLSRMAGPYVIIGRGHSGTRFLAETFLSNRFYMGSHLNKASDSLNFRFKFVQPLINSDFFPNWSENLEGGNQEFFNLSDRLLQQNLMQFTRKINDENHWGWKMGSSAFVMPVIKHYFPSARFVHIIRDARDVTLSSNGTLELPFHRTYPKNPVKLVHNLLTKDWSKITDYRLKEVFNSSNLRTWNGIKLNKKDVYRNRYQIGVLSWINFIQTARKYSKSMEHDYYEIRYEKLCRNPVAEIRKLFAFLCVDLSESAKQYVIDHARTDRLGKWKTMQFETERKADFEKAVEIGKPLLRELHYMV